VGWLITLRWLAIAGVVAAVEIGRRLLEAPLRAAELYTVVAALALYNVILTIIRMRLQRGLGRLVRATPWRILRPLLPRPLWGIAEEGEVLRAALFANVQISIDLVFLATLLHLAGGIENPFIFFFLFHGNISSALLSRRITYVQVTFGFALICLVAAGECAGVLPHYPLDGLFLGVRYDDPVTVAVMLLVLGLTLSISVYMCSTIIARLRNREREVVVLSQELSNKTQELQSAYESIRQTEQMKSRYLRKVAHELRGPLGTVQTALRVVLKGLTGEIPAQTRDLVGRAERRARELIAVMEDLLELSRVREGRFSPEKAVLDPAQLVLEVVADFESRASDAGLTLEVDVASDTGPIEGDRSGLQQLVRNLLGNAVRYTPSGGRIAIGLHRRDDALELVVQDTGIGIPPEDLPHIFAEFYRAGNARARTEDGTGLGLSIVKAVADQHGGVVHVDSLPEGTRIAVVLPTASETPA
jgi:signal transduction histidine kinase